MDGKEKYLTVRQFAKLLHYSERRIRQMIKAEKITAHRIPGSRKLLIPMGELERLKKEAEKGLRAKLISVKKTRGHDVKLTRPYDRERFAASDRIMDERDLAHLLNSLRNEHFYTISDFQKVLRWVSFFNLKSNDYYDPDIGQLCSQLNDSVIELIIFMKLEFVKAGHKSIYRLIYDDTIGRPEETLAYKKRQLDELVDKIKRQDRIYRSAINEKLLV